MERARVQQAGLTWQPHGHGIVAGLPDLFFPFFSPNPQRGISPGSGTHPCCWAAAPCRCSQPHRGPRGCWHHDLHAHHEHKPCRGCLWPQPAMFCASPAAVRLPPHPQNLSLQRVSPACSSTKPSPSLQPRAGVRRPAADPTARPKGTSSPSAEPKSSSLLKIHS